MKTTSTRLTTTTMALILVSTTPMIVATDVLANSAASIKVDLIELPHDIASDYLIGLTEKGDLIALKKADDGTTLSKIAVASYDNNDQIIFVPAELQQGEDGLYFEPMSTGGVLMLDNSRALKIDPRFVAIILMQADGGEYLGELVMVADGEELLFGPQSHVGNGTVVTVTKHALPKKTVLVAVTATDGVVLSMEVSKSGQTWIAKGEIGHLDDDLVENVSVTKLAAFGIGIPTTMPASTGAGHDKVSEGVAA